MGTYPFAFEADFAESRNRLTTFFRWLLAIPHLLFMTVLGIVAAVCIVVAWFAQVIAATYPAGMYRFVLAYLRLGLQLGAYLLLATDRYPSFSLDGGEPAVRFVGREEPAAEYSRWKALLRYFLMIPWGILNFAYMMVAYLAAIGSWFVIVFTGRQHPTLQKGLHMGLASSAHYNSFAMLLADEWPPIEPELRLEPRGEPVAISAA